MLKQNLESHVGCARCNRPRAMILSLARNLCVTRPAVLPLSLQSRATAPESKVARCAQLCASHWVQGSPLPRARGEEPRISLRVFFPLNFSALRFPINGAKLSTMFECFRSPPALFITL
jgi:hypothetical protein